MLDWNGHLLEKSLKSAVTKELADAHDVGVHRGAQIMEPIDAFRLFRPLLFEGIVPSLPGGRHGDVHSRISRIDGAVKIGKVIDFHLVPNAAQLHQLQQASSG